jgi:hypothetical protein
LSRSRRGRHSTFNDRCRAWRRSDDNRCHLDFRGFFYQHGSAAPVYRHVLGLALRLVTHAGPIHVVRRIIGRSAWLDIGEGRVELIEVVVE